MIVFKKITFLDTEEEIDKKINNLLNIIFMDDDEEENIFKINPSLTDFLSINEEIEEYAYEFKDKRGALIVTRKKLWDKFVDVINTAGVKYLDEDIQDLFYTGQIENDFFQSNANIYMLKHMTIDEVLDKMNKYGKKYLTEIDYEILKKVKNLYNSTEKPTNL